MSSALGTRSRVAEGTKLPPVYPRSRTLPRFNDFHTANRFTSACSFTIYRDDLSAYDPAADAWATLDSPPECKQISHISPGGSAPAK